MDSLSGREKEQIYFRPPARIVAVDDSELNISFISNSFLAPNYILYTAMSGSEGIALIQKEKPELILLDIMMPEMDGYEVAARLKADPELKDIPIIFITALDAIKDKLRAFDAGAVDFVTKPFNHKELIARVRTNVELRRMASEKEKLAKIAMEERHNSAIARIAAGISHNFNNMLGVSFGNTLLIESILGKNLDPVAGEALRDVKKSLSRMQRMVKQFLLLANGGSHMKSGKIEPSVFNLHDMADEVISNLKEHKKNAPVPLEVNCINDINRNFEVYFDPSHMNEILHLIINEAVDITLGKSLCSISSLAEASGGRSQCLIRIKNIQHETPCGDDVPDIFEPFGLPIANVGSGLSFAVAKYLVELNSCSISAKVPEKDEIIFTITFPCPNLY